MDEREVRTLPSRTTGLPLKALRIEVVEGPDAGKEIAVATERVTVGTSDGNDLVLRDPKVSRYHLELARRGDRIAVLDLGSTNGTAIGAPPASALIERAFVLPGTILTAGDTRLRVEDGETVTLEIHADESLGALRGRSPSMRRLMARIAKAAMSDGSVLIVGESGTGKELIARALHDGGPRRAKPFVTVDGAALSPTLAASELFGHEKGAFTGADRQHKGALELANGGTVFLDEVGELPAPLQATLLGALERRRFRRVGGRDEIEVDIRLVAATHRDLRAEVNRGAFRLDLYFRLAVVLLDVPSLRERRDDVPMLVEHFVREAGHAEPIGELFSPDALDALSAHHWPGNVRELRNLVESTLAMGEMPALDGALAASGSAAPAAIPPRGSEDLVAKTIDEPYKSARKTVLDDFEARYLRRLLERTKGNISLASREAGMDRSHLIDLLDRHGLRPR